MKGKYPITLSVLGLVVVLTCGCVAVSVGGKHKDEPPKAPTVQQQLNDLERARKSGAITDEQYETQRTKLLESQ